MKILALHLAAAITLVPTSTAQSTASSDEAEPSTPALGARLDAEGVTLAEDQHAHALAARGAELLERFAA